ncbi:MAG TPA: Ig-like domain-containing protein [Gemmatimonadales bacterium]|nr:Ig-like domain-containing protein [Gemmatimonadales bacterium]
MSRRLHLIWRALVPPLLLASTCPGSSEPTLVATTIVLSPPSVPALAAIGATVRLAATVNDQNGNALAKSTVSWATSTPGVATVDGTGLVTAVANGSAQITATSGTARDSLSVTVAQVPVQVLKVSGDSQSGIVGQPLGQPLVVLVNDANAHAVAGATVGFAAASGSGSLASSQTTTGASGQGQMVWTLGQTAGGQAASATVGTLPPLQFHATASAGASASVTKQAGDRQTAITGQPIAIAPAVLVRDAFNNPEPGASVTFTVSAGNGALGGAAATTNANGVAAVGSWTLGNVGTDTLIATVAGSGISGNPVMFTATSQPTPTLNVAKQAGDGQTGLSGRALPIAPAVVVRDAQSNPKAGVSVTFAATPANGVVTGATTTTNASGVATVGSWSLGNVGTDTLTATVAGSGIGGNPAVFTATAQPSGTVLLYAGNNEMGLVGYAVNVRPGVRVVDPNGNPVSGVTVTFAVTSGGGSLTGGTTTTDVNGIAQVGSWTIGATPARNTMAATVGMVGLTGNPITFSDTGAAGVYNIQIQYYGPTPSATQQAAFTAAVARWQSIIYQHVGPPIQVTDAGNQCGAGEPAVNQTVSDLLILAKFDSIDGPGKILAQSGPCLIRISNGLTVLGVMVFDTADVATLIADGQLNEVVLHEMNHVLGFGTLWSQAPNNCLLLPSTPPGTIQDTYFGCAHALAAFDSMGGGSYTGAGTTPPAGNKVPVENCATAPYVYPACGAGTVNGHWREVVFTNELMTGYLNSGSNPLSVLSIAAQEDLGYTVNYAAADPYSHVFMAPPVSGGPPPVVLGDDVRQGPIYVIDASGTVVRTIER